MFENLHAVPADPLLGLIARYQQDPRPEKIDLGVGVYKTEEGTTPVLECVKAAEQYLVQHQMSKSYLGPRGDAAFADHLNEVVAGSTLFEKLTHRIASLQTPGGCGALRAAAEMIKIVRPDTTIWVSDPTWANHEPLLGNAGIQIRNYPYYDFKQKSLNFDGMCAQLEQLPEGDIVLLHACCHNPSGADLNQTQWTRVIEILRERRLVPFIDIAYQGFGDGLDDDAFGIRLAMASLPEVIYTVSCSKNFGLYRDRVGLVAFLVQSETQAGAVVSHLAKIVRGIYSMPPDHGAAVVSHILQSTELAALWQQELSTMRNRIQSMRVSLAEGMKSQGKGDRFDFVTREKGMFSFLGISPEQVNRLAQEYGVYMADSSRINVAGLNSQNMDRFVASLAKVIA